MHLLTDKEMFSHVPQADGSILYTDTTRHILDMNITYASDISDCPHLEGFEHRTYKSDSAINKSISLQNHLDNIWHKTFLYMEAKIERYLDSHNGFIGQFPSSVKPAFQGPKGRTFDFEYFNSAPKGYICPREERLNTQYHKLQDPAVSRFSRTLWGGILSLLLILFFLCVSGILGAVPAVKNYLVAHTVICYGLIAIPSVAVVIVGLFLPMHLLGKKIDPTKFYPKAILMFGLGVGSAGVLLAELMSSTTALFSFFVKYLLLAYLAAMVIFYTVHLFKALPAYREFLRIRPQLVAEFVKLYEEDANNLHRYLRLRQLWFAYEHGNSGSVPGWCKRIQKRFRTYTKLYNKFS